MIFGKTYRQRYANEQSYLLSWHKVPYRLWFAWRPVRLDDGRIAFLQMVVKNVSVYRWNFRWCESSTTYHPIEDIDRLTEKYHELFPYEE